MSLKDIFSATNGNEHNRGFKLAEAFGVAGGAALGASFGVAGAAVGGVAGLYVGRAIANSAYAVRKRFTVGL